MRRIMDCGSALPLSDAPQPSKSAGESQSLFPFFPAVPERHLRRQYIVVLSRGVSAGSADSWNAVDWGRSDAQSKSDSRVLQESSDLAACCAQGQAPFGSGIPFGLRPPGFSPVARICPSIKMPHRLPGVGRFAESRLSAKLREEASPTRLLQSRSSSRSDDFRAQRFRVEFGPWPDRSHRLANAARKRRPEH